MSLKFSIVIVSFLFLASCGKDEFKVNYSNGLAIVTQQGEEITYQAYGREYSNHFGWTFRLATFNELGYLRRSLTFSYIPKEPGIYGLDGVAGILDSLVTVSYATKLSDGDVIEDFYKVRREDGKSVGTITIFEYYETSGWVKGEFDAEFELTKEVPNNPDNTKIMHLKGEFQLRIVD